MLQPIATEPYKPTCHQVLTVFAVFADNESQWRQSRMYTVNELVDSPSLQW